MRFAQDHDVVQAISPDRADEAFDVPILPGRAGRRWSVPDAHGRKTSRDGMAIRGISVANEVLGRLIPREGLGDLLGDPLSCRVGGDVDPNQLASVMRDDHQAIEQPEADGRHDEHIDGTDVRSMIAQEGLPALRRRTASSNHVLGDGRLGDVEPELEQFTVNTRRTPQWVRPAHLGDERAQLMGNLGSADAAARSPPPIGPEASTVPANDCFWSDDRKGACGGGKPAMNQTNSRRSTFVRAGRLGIRRRSTLTCCRRTRFSASSSARDLNSDAKTAKISLNRSVIGPRA